MGLKERCARCGKYSLVTDFEVGERFCSSCGLVLPERIENLGPDWRSFDDGQNRVRGGANTTLTKHDLGLSTVIDPTNRDATGKPLSVSMKYTVQRLRLWDRRSQNSPFEKNLKFAFSELGKLKDKLSLSDSVVEKAAYFYRKVLEKKFVRGRSISSMIGASLYAACREVGTPRTLKEIATSLNISKRNLSSCYRLLVFELDLKVPVVDAVQNVSRIASQLGLSEKTKRYAMDIIRKAEEFEISAGKNPMALAATALYISCTQLGETHTQKDLAMAANITEVTIRNRSKNLENLIFPKGELTRHT